MQGDVVEQSRADEERHEAARAQPPVARMEREGYGGERESGDELCGENPYLCGAPEVGDYHLEQWAQQHGQT